jgi:hypothetical protein
MWRDGVGIHTGANAGMLTGVVVAGSCSRESRACCSVIVPPVVTQCYPVAWGVGVS